MRSRLTTLAVILLIMSASARATSFVVPSDDELVAKSAAIVVGTVEGSYVDERQDDIRTVHEIRIERALKGPLAPSALVPVVVPGGDAGDHGVIVPGAPEMRQGQRLLLFLTRDGEGWAVTDLMLGKFKFVTSTAGVRLLVRDMEDVVEWDRPGGAHRERVRHESGFLQFIEDTVHGKARETNYRVDSADVTLTPETATSLQVQTNASPYPPQTYTSWVSNQPTRWANISAGVTFYKRSDQNIAGAADGGVSVIQNALAAWNNECGSNVNLIYGGQRATASANFDGISVVEFNDPQGRVSGSWTGSGTIAITFTSYSSPHTFNGVSYLSVTDADVVFQDGFNATHAAFGTAMTHEVGHGIGWRHSNQHYLNGGACDASVEECTSTAIMNSSVVASYAFNLQPWDVHAAQAVYPGGTCTSCTPPSITTQPVSTSVTAGGSVTLRVVAAGTTPLSYQWYAGASGNTANPISGATGNSFTVTPAATTSYWVRVTNACGTANSVTATVTVNAAPPPVPTGGVIENRTDFDGDGRADLFWRHLGDGRDAVWFMNGASVLSSVQKATIPLVWRPTAFGDFNGDGKSDLFWRNVSTGANALWLFTSRSASSALNVASMPTQWTVEVSGDFNGDGRFDVLWHNQSTNANTIWYMSGVSVTAASAPTVAAGFEAEAAGDFDGDGDYDILWRNNSTGGNFLWIMSGSGPTQQNIASLASSWRVQGTGDFNKDGRSDVLWRVQSSGANQVWLMNGAPFQSTTVASVPSGWTVAVIGDFNADGTHDIAWRGSNGYNFIMFMANGTVGSQSAFTALGDQNWQIFGLP